MSDGILIELIKCQQRTLKRIRRAMNKRCPLPKELRKMQIEVRPDGKLVIAAGFHECGGYISWTAVPFSDFSQTLTCLNDLERFVCDNRKEQYEYVYSVPSDSCHNPERSNNDV